jgi:HNH endonuclease
MARKSLSKKLRFDVFKRDGFKCIYCGATPPSALLHVDHIVPVAGGGGNEIDNLVTACQPCNLGKSDTPLSVIPKSLKEKAVETQELEDQLQGYQSILSAMRCRIEDEAWEVADAFNETHAPKSTSFRRDWLASIKRFIERLGLHETLVAMELATSRKPYSEGQCFRYFCGICWSKIKQMEGE